MRAIRVGAIGVVLCLVASTVSAQENHGNEKLSLHDRVWIATQIYDAIHTYFGHWQAVRDLDFDKEFETYLDQITATDDRVAFDLATLELIAKLKNGHSGFNDYWLIDNHGQRLGFQARRIDGSWVVIESSIDNLKRGDIIARINGQPFHDFFLGVRKYLVGSNQREQEVSLTNRPYLFPSSFELETSDGRKVPIVRKGWPKDEHYQMSVQGKDGIAYIKIPSFNDPKLEETAIDAVKRLSNSKAMIIDVRGNTGGSTPEALLGRLMNRRFRWWTESIALSSGMLKFRGMLGEHSDLFSYGGPSDPEKDAYEGALYLLVDEACGSACEDFLIPFKDNHRAVIVGETTSGSTGQPVPIDFGNGMHLGIGARRVFFPDGSQFEGIGIAPDVEVHTTAEDLRAGRDPVLARAYALIREDEAQKTH